MIEWIGLAAGTSFAAGLNLYATVATLGLLQRFGVATLPPSLAVLSHPAVITVALVLFVVEFVADKIPFFDNVGHRQVHQTLRRHGFGRDVARLLTRLLTLRGSLPQGGASSPAMANLFASMSIDSALAPSIAQRGLQYTRFVDDLTISGKAPQDVLQEVAGLLSAQGLKINRKKLAITPNSARQEVTGLVTNDANRLSISRRRRDAVRAAIYQIKRDAPPESELQRRVRSVNGRIAVWVWSRSTYKIGRSLYFVTRRPKASTS